MVVGPSEVVGRELEEVVRCCTMWRLRGHVGDAVTDRIMHADTCVMSACMHVWVHHHQSGERCCAGDARRGGAGCTNTVRLKLLQGTHSH